ncbi:holo-ACP synthase [[Eubacterium] hominis]|uniref:holo-ACP synthase n=1 Tax=[Eubacterium] hominis TaxID=2764325 RepID=UPI003A4D6572
MIIGIGTDIVEIQRIEKALHKPVIHKILTEKEQMIANQYQGHRKSEWIAGRFAAKEAIYKAIHNVVDCMVWDIEILMDESGAPVCSCFPYDVMVSIAHEKEYAIAYAMVQTKES